MFFIVQLRLRNNVRKNVYIPAHWCMGIDMQAVYNGGIDKNRDYVVFFSKCKARHPNFSLAINDKFIEEDACYIARYKKCEKTMYEARQYVNRMRSVSPVRYTEKRMKQKRSNIPVEVQTSLMPKSSGQSRPENSSRLIPILYDSSTEYSDARDHMMTEDSSQSGLQSESILDLASGSYEVQQNESKVQQTEAEVQQNASGQSRPENSRRLIPILFDSSTEYSDAREAEVQQREVQQNEAEVQQHEVQQNEAEVQQNEAEVQQHEVQQHEVNENELERIQDILVADLEFEFEQGKSLPLPISEEPTIKEEPNDTEQQSSTPVVTRHALFGNLLFELEESTGHVIFNGIRIRSHIVTLLSMQNEGLNNNIFTDKKFIYMLIMELFSVEEILSATTIDDLSLDRITVIRDLFEVRIGSELTRGASLDKYIQDAFMYFKKSHQDK